MAWTSVGSLGSSNNKSTQGYLDLNPSRAVPADSIVVVWTAWDNVYSIFSDYGAAPYPRVLGVEDSAGNLYAELGGVNDRRCFFLCGAGFYLFVSQLRAPLSTTDVIRVDLNDTTTTILEAKAMSAWEFTVPEGYGWCATGDDPSSDVETGDPIPIGFNTPLNTEHLWLWGMGQESPPTDVVTLDPDYTSIDVDGTSGGADIDMMSVYGGWRIYTGNSDVVDVTNTTSGSRNSAQMLTALMAVPKLVTFPRTPIIDDFNRADEDPLDGGIWVPYFDESPPNESQTTGPSSPGTRLLQLVSNESVAGPTNAGGQATVIEYTCDDMEVYATYAHVSAGGGIDVQMMVRGTSDDANLSGYGLVVRSSGWGTGGGGPPGWWWLMGGEIGNQGFIGHTALLIWLPVYSAPEDGWKLGLQRWRKFMNVWIDIGGGWQWWGAWYDAYGQDGKLGHAIWDPVSRVDDFGGGPTCFLVALNHRSATRHKSASRALVNPSDV